MKNPFKTLFNRRQTSASQAKERLQIIVSHQRQRQQLGGDFMPQLQEELIAVISKYVPIQREQVNIALEQLGNQSILELNIALNDEQPEKVTEV